MKIEIFIHCWFFFRLQLCLFVKSLSMSLTCSTGLLIVWAASDLRQLGWAMGSLTRWVNLWKQDLKSPSIISTLNCQCLSCVKHSLVLSVLAALIWPFDRSHLSNFQISNLSQKSHSSNQQITLFTKLTNPFLTSSYFEWMALVLAEPAVPVAAEVLVFPPIDAWISQVAYAPANSTTLLGLELFARWAEACTWSTRIQTGSEWDQGCGVQNATSSWLASSWQTFEAKIWFCLRVYKLYLVGGIFHIHMLNLNDCFMFQAAERWSGPTQWIAMRVPRDWPCTGWRLLATRPQMQKRLRSLSIAWGLHWVGLLWLSEWLQMVLRFKLRIGRTCSSTMPSWLATCREILEPPT